jgi:pyruvate dehydrogenase complex dehydrogenase (E1) component
MELRDLQKLTVVKLREEALRQGNIIGVHGMGKGELIATLAPLYGIDLEAETTAARERIAQNKTTLKQRIRAFKVDRNTALAEHNAAQLEVARRGIKRQKQALRRLTRRVQAKA